MALHQELPSKTFLMTGPVLNAAQARMSLKQQSNLHYQGKVRYHNVMVEEICRKSITSFLIYVLFLFVFHTAQLHAEELTILQTPARDIKGFWEVNIFTQTVIQSVVEETRAGKNFTGDAESTRVIARLATKPWHPFELYLQAGTANLYIDDFGEYWGDYRLAYGGGFYLTIYDHPGPKKFQVLSNLDALYFTTKDDRVLVSVCNNITCVDDLASEEIRWGEWSLTGIGIWRSQYWEPYAGVRFSMLDSKDKLEGPILGRRNLSLKEDNNLGFVFGTNIYFDPRENFAFNAEAALIDQFSLKIGIKLWY